MTRSQSNLSSKEASREPSCENLPEAGTSARDPAVKDTTAASGPSVADKKDPAADDKLKRSSRWLPLQLADLGLLCCYHLANPVTFYCDFFVFLLLQDLSASFGEVVPDVINEGLLAFPHMTGHSHFLIILM